MIDESDYQHAQAFRRKYCRRYRLGRDMSVDGEIMGYYIESYFKPPRRAEAGEFPWGCWQYDTGELAALAPNRTAKKICERFPWVRLQVDSDEGGLLVFPADRLQELEVVLKLRRRRKLSESQREKLLEASRATRFLPGLMDV